MSETDRFDALLMNIAQTQRGIEPLLDTVFSFLRRKTDFFSGATPEVIEETILKCVRKQAILAEKDQFHKKQQEEEKRKKRLAEEALKKKKKEEADRARAAAAVPAVEPPRFEEITDEDKQAPEQKVAASGEAEKKNEGGAGSAPEEGGDEEDDGPGKVLVQLSRHLRPALIRMPFFPILQHRSAMADKPTSTCGPRRCRKRRRISRFRTARNLAKLSLISARANSRLG